MAPLLFLSHSGADTEAARALKKRLEAAPEAAALGLKVWFDKDNLQPGGKGWQEQLEEAIKAASAFAVYVGTKGIVNWVEAEVRLGLSRAFGGEGRFPFIPILSAASEGSSALPGFVQQFQAVRDVEKDEDEFRKLVSAILDVTDTGSLRLETEPFFGLKAVDEARSHLFFGREQETDELVKRLATSSLLMVTGDSGSGKSSLARAGVLPKWRGGTVAEFAGQHAGDIIWHVIDTRPGGNPRRALGDAVFDAAKALGRSLEECGLLKKWTMEGNAEEIRDALRCGLSARDTRTLLLVDQFEELWTLAPADQRTAFIDLLLELADPRDGAFTVLLTMRLDYYFQCSEHSSLYSRLEASDRRCRYLVGRMKDQGLWEIVTRPLRLAGVSQDDAETLARSVLGDVGERPGDLALVQFALTETWHRRADYGGDLVTAYVSPEVGRVEGALARAAERVFERQLLEVHREAEIEAVFLRLVRLGDAGGATRRLASRHEFTGRQWENMLQLLASDSGNRLVLISGGGGEGEERAEISHEALVTQWPRFQRWLLAAASDKRTFENLIDDAREWNLSPDDRGKSERVATGAQLEQFVALADKYPLWFSAAEKAFLKASQKLKEDAEAAEDARQQAEKYRQQKVLDAARRKARNARAVALAVIGTLLLGATGWGVYRFWVTRDAYLTSYMIDSAAGVPGREDKGEIDWLVALSVAGRLTEATQFQGEPGVSRLYSICPIARRLGRRADIAQLSDGIKKLIAAPDAISRFHGDCLEAAVAVGKRDPDRAVALVNDLRPYFKQELWKLVDAYRAIGRPNEGAQLLPVAARPENLFIQLGYGGLCSLATYSAGAANMGLAQTLLSQVGRRPLLTDINDVVECAVAYRATRNEGEVAYLISLVKSHFGFLKFDGAFGARKAERSLDSLAFLGRLAGAGLLPEALDVASSYPDPYGMALAKVAILRGLPPGSGKVLDVVNSAAESADKETSVYRVVDLHLLIALNLLEHVLGDPEKRDKTLALVRIADRRGQGLPTRYDPGSRIDRSAARASNLADIAIVYSKFGEIGLAHQMAREAETVSREIVVDRSSVLTHVARALARTCEHSLAVEVADRIYDGARLTAYAWILEEMTESK